MYHASAEGMALANLTGTYLKNANNEDEHEEESEDEYTVRRTFIVSYSSSYSYSSLDALVKIENGKLSRGKLFSVI